MKYDSTPWLLAIALALTAAACGGSSTSDGADGGSPDADSPGEPILIHDGPLGSFQGVPGWSADDPFPLITMERTVTENDQYWNSTVGPVFSFDADGRATKIGSIDDDARVRIWSMRDTNYSLAFGGQVGDGVVAGWNPAQPTPFLLMDESERGWAIYPAGLYEDGSIRPVDGGEVRVFQWPSKTPEVRATPAVISLPDWNPDEPRPVIILHHETNGVWSHGGAAVSDDGTVRVFQLAQDAVVFRW